MKPVASTLDQKLAEAANVFVERLRARLLHVVDPEEVDADDLGAAAADWAAAALDTAGTSLLARRIGPVYVIGDLTHWLTAPGGGPLTDEAVRKRAVKRQLVGFHTDDGHWAFPAWQFDRAAGRLVPRDEVIAVWQRLPHDGFLTDADLAAWMNTHMTSLDATPAAYAHRHGADAPALEHAISRLVARAN